MTELRHYSEEFVFDPWREYEDAGYFKPRGLWLSVGDDWDRWCWENDFCDHQSYSEVDVDLSGVLRLDTDQKILDFTHEWARAQQDARLNRNGYVHEIDWPSVARAFTGILISPFSGPMHRHRMTFWYYGWDCASACIWDLSAVRSVSASVPVIR